MVSQMVAASEYTAAAPRPSTGQAAAAVRPRMSSQSMGAPV